VRFRRESNRNARHRFRRGSVAIFLQSVYNGIT